MSNIKKFRIKSFKENKSILNLDKISLKFGRKIILDNLNLKLNNGQILGLLGPNGAGKSTTILMLTTLLSITKGSASILGIDVETQDKQVREKIGVALQDTGIDPILTGRELFFTTCRLWGYSKADSETRTNEL